MDLVLKRSLLSHVTDLLITPLWLLVACHLSCDHNPVRLCQIHSTSPRRLGLAHVAHPGDRCGALGDAPSDGHLRQRRLWAMLLCYVFHGIQQSRPCHVFPQLKQVEQKSFVKSSFVKKCNVKCKVTKCYDMLYSNNLKHNHHCMLLFT